MKTPIRIFITSAFAEMTQERDILVRRVFPLLRTVCNERNVDLIDVDLRWGITEESFSIEALNQIVGPEINRASIFVALLGKTFGWIPEGEYDSTTALEMYRAIASPSLNLLAFWKNPERSFELAKGATNPIDTEQDKLIRGIPLHKYDSYEQFAELSHRSILALLETLYFSKIGTVFLSYSRKDSARAEQLGDILQSFRFNVWRDTSDIETGADWPDLLAQGIEESDLVLFLASGNSSSSPYCSKEIAHATNLQKPMITVHLDDGELPKKIAFLVSDSQHLWIGQYESLEDAVTEVSRAAKRMIRSPNQANSADAKSSAAD